MIDEIIHEYDMVALLEDVETEHFETRRRILLPRGSVGTVVMVYDKPDRAFEVEFSREDGCTYAMLALKAHQLLVLRNFADAIAA